MAKIRVEDQGEGIQPEHLAKVFDPFFTTREGEGETSPRGLGLPIVQAIVEAHGGRVSLRSRPGEGTAVELRIPLSEEPDEAQRSADLTAETLPGIVETAAAPSVRPAAPGGDVGVADPEPWHAADPEPGHASTRRAPRILLVEDDTFLAGLIERTLTRSGFAVEVVWTTIEGGRRWQSLDGDVDLLVVERRLSEGHSGVNFAMALRKEAPDLPVVVLDRRSTPGGGAATAGGFPILTRPFEPADVLALVREELAGRRAGRGGRPETR